MGEKKRFNDQFVVHKISLNLYLIQKVEIFFDNLNNSHLK